MSSQVPMVPTGPKPRVQRMVQISTSRTITLPYSGQPGAVCSYYIQHCFVCRPSDSAVPTDAGIVPRTVETSALAVRRSNH